MSKSNKDFTFWALMDDPKFTKKSWFKEFTIPTRPMVGEHVHVMANRKVKRIFHFPAETTGGPDWEYPATTIVSFGNYNTKKWGWDFKEDSQWEEAGWTPHLSCG